jgi:hypothetical protein
MQWFTSTYLLPFPGSSCRTACKMAWIKCLGLRTERPRHQYFTATGRQCRCTVSNRVPSPENMDPISLHSAEHSVQHTPESYINLLQARLRMASPSVSSCFPRQYALTSLFRGDHFTGYSNSFCICFATEQCSRNSKMQCQRYRYRETDYQR